jgi:hypothetical protein
MVFLFRSESKMGTKRGPKEQRLAINGNWQDALKYHSLQRSPQPDGHGVFEIAAKKYHRWHCDVGECNKAGMFGARGIGCVLDASHILTARHCVKSTTNPPAVFRVFSVAPDYAG